MNSTMDLMFFGAEANDLIDEGIRFKSLPPNYVAWLLIPLACVFFAWLVYRRETGAPRWVRFTSAAARALTIFFVCLLLFEPYRHFLQVNEIRSLVMVMVDESSSMKHVEAYDQEPELAADVPRRRETSRRRELEGVHANRTRAANSRTGRT